MLHASASRVLGFAWAMATRNSNIILRKLLASVLLAYIRQPVEWVPLVESSTEPYCFIDLSKGGQIRDWPWNSDRILHLLRVGWRRNYWIAFANCLKSCSFSAWQMEVSAELTEEILNWVRLDCCGTWLMLTSLEFFNRVWAWLTPPSTPVDWHHSRIWSG